MPILTEIKDLLKLVATNQRAGLWFIIIAIMLGGGAFLYKNIKPVSRIESECDFIKAQNKELVNFLIEAKKEVQQLSVQATSYLPQYNIAPRFALYIDKPVKKTPMQQKAVLLSRFDSLLLKIRQDSINHARQKSKN